MAACTQPALKSFAEPDYNLNPISATEPVSKDMYCAKALRWLRTEW